MKTIVGFITLFAVYAFAGGSPRVNERATNSQAALRRRTGSTLMHLIINGQDHDDLPDGLTIAGLIAHLKLPERKIAIERNRAVVPKSTFGEVQLEDHDQLEIIHFIGGG